MSVRLLINAVGVWMSLLDIPQAFAVCVPEFLCRVISLSRLQNIGVLETLWHPPAGRRSPVSYIFVPCQRHGNKNVNRRSCVRAMPGTGRSFLMPFYLSTRIAGGRCSLTRYSAPGSGHLPGWPRIASGTGAGTRRRRRSAWLVAQLALGCRLWPEVVSQDLLDRPRALRWKGGKG